MIFLPDEMPDFESPFSIYEKNTSLLSMPDTFETVINIQVEKEKGYPAKLTSLDEDDYETDMELNTENPVFIFRVGNEEKLRIEFSNHETNEIMFDVLCKTIQKFLEEYYWLILSIQFENEDVAERLKKQDDCNAYRQLYFYYRDVVNDRKQMFHWAKKWAQVSSRGRNILRKLYGRFGDFRNQKIFNKMIRRNPGEERKDF